MAEKWASQLVLAFWSHWRYHDQIKASYESWVQQLTPFDSWTLTAGILLSKVLFFSNKRTILWLQIVHFFIRIKIHCMILRYKTSKLNFILLNKPKSEDNLPVKLNGQYIWFFLKYTIWSHNLVLLLLKKRTLLSKIPAVSVHESKRVSCCSKLWKRL